MVRRKSVFGGFILAKNLYAARATVNRKRDMAFPVQGQQVRLCYVWRWYSAKGPCKGMNQYFAIASVRGENTRSFRTTETVSLLANPQKIDLRVCRIVAVKVPVSVSTVNDVIRLSFVVAVMGTTIRSRSRVGSEALRKAMRLYCTQVVRGIPSIEISTSVRESPATRTIALPLISPTGLSSTSRHDPE